LQCTNGFGILVKADIHQQMTHKERPVVAHNEETIAHIQEVIL